MSANRITLLGTIVSETWSYFSFDFLKYRLPGLTPGTLFELVKVRILEADFVCLFLIKALWKILVKSFLS